MSEMLFVAKVARSDDPPGLGVEVGVYEACSVYQHGHVRIAGALMDDRSKAGAALECSVWAMLHRSVSRSSQQSCAATIPPCDRPDEEGLFTRSFLQIRFPSLIEVDSL